MSGEDDEGLAYTITCPVCWCRGYCQDSKGHVLARPHRRRVLAAKKDRAI